MSLRVRAALQWRFWMRMLALVFPAALLSACEEESGPNISGVPGFDIRWVEITPDVDTIFVPDTIRVTDRLPLQAVAYGTGSERLPVTRFVWTSSDTSIAVVTESGVVIPRRTGAVEIQASATRIGKAQVVIFPAAQRVVVQPGPGHSPSIVTHDSIFVDEPAIAENDTLKLLAFAFDAEDRPVPGVRFTWSSEPASVGAIDSTGVFRAMGFGDAVVTVTGNGFAGTRVIRVRSRTTRAAIFGARAQDLHYLSEVPAVDSIFVDDPIVASRDVRLRSARAFDRHNTMMASREYRARWSSSATHIVRIDTLDSPLGNPLEWPTLSVTPLALGSSTITLQIGQATTTSRIDVVPIVHTISLSSPAAQVLAGDTLQLTAVARDYSGQPIARTFRWASLDPAIASIDANGRAIFVTPGTARFTATSAYRTASVSVTALPRELTTVSNGGDFSCGIAQLRRLYCWGRADVGQTANAPDSTCFSGLPLDSTVSCVIQARRSAEPSTSYTEIATADATGCGINTSGLIFCWGWGWEGTLGNGGTGLSFMPVAATVLNERFSRIAGGGRHFCALNTQGYAYCWGSDSHGQLGDTLRINSTTPIPVVGPDGLMATRIVFSAIAAGSQHTCGIEAGTGQAWCWGDGTSGQRGDGTTASVQRPRRVSSGVRFRQIEAGDRHTCAVSEDDQLYCWGANSTGQLGTGNTVSTSAPVLVGSGYRQVATGADFTCAVTSAGSISCWGNNERGQLGRGEGTPTGYRPSPAPIILPRSFRMVTSGSRHACAVDTDGNTWCWGNNEFGALGNGLQAAMRAVPERIAPLR